MNPPDEEADEGETAHIADAVRISYDLSGALQLALHADDEANRRRRLMQALADAERLVLDMRGLVDIYDCVALSDIREAMAARFWDASRAQHLELQGDCPHTAACRPCPCEDEPPPQAIALLVERMIGRFEQLQKRSVTSFFANEFFIRGGVAGNNDSVRRLARALATRMLDEDTAPEEAALCTLTAHLEVPSLEASLRAELHLIASEECDTKTAFGEVFARSAKD